MFRFLLLVAIVTVVGCARLPRQPAVEASALIVSRYVEAAMHEKVKQIYVKVEGADSTEDIKAVSRPTEEVSILSGSYEFEIRDGRFREKKSNTPCYSIVVVVLQTTPESAAIRVSSTLSFGGIAVTEYVLKYSR